ncbi:hypothetical protein ACFX15_022411 [Malus domestica]
MFTLSATPSTTFLTPRVSPSSLSSSSPSAASCSSLSSSSRLCLVSVRRRSSASPCLFSSLKVSAMAELVKDTESLSLSPIQSAERTETDHSRTFLSATTEQGNVEKKVHVEVFLFMLREPIVVRHVFFHKDVQCSFFDP